MTIAHLEAAKTQSHRRLCLADKQGNERTFEKEDRVACVSRPVRKPMEIANMNKEAYQQWMEGPTDLDTIKRALASTLVATSGNRRSASISHRYSHWNEVLTDVEIMLENACDFLLPKDSDMLRDKIVAMQHYVATVKAAKPITLNDVASASFAGKKRRR